LNDRCTYLHDVGLSIIIALTSIRIIYPVLYANLYLLQETVANARKDAAF